MNLGYTGKPYDTATGLYNYGYRDYKPEAARFTTIDPVRDGANWFAYVNNDPVNWVDLWGLADIAVWDALDRSDKYSNYDFNLIAYNKMVDQSFTEISKAAAEKGLSVEIIRGADATETRLKEVLQDDPQRVVVLAHGDNNGNIYDSQGKRVNISNITISNTIQTVDVVACYADQGISVWNNAGVSDVRTYNSPNQEIKFFQTNDVLNKDIPASIRNDGAKINTTPTNTQTLLGPIPSGHEVSSVKGVRCND
jgi:RHS repeat-associated protein